MGTSVGRATEATTRLIHTQRVAHIQRGCTPPVRTSQPAVPPPHRLPASTGHAAQPPHRHEPDTGRWLAKRHLPTKPTLPTASIDANHPATRCASARGPYWPHRATQLAVDPLLRHPALSRAEKCSENPPSRTGHHHRLRPPASQRRRALRRPAC